MKYSKTNPPIVHMQTNSTCHKGIRAMILRSVLWRDIMNNINGMVYFEASEPVSVY